MVHPDEEVYNRQTGQEKPLRIQTETRKLPTELSPEDLAKESDRLAASVKEVEKQEEHIAEQKGLWSEKRKAMEGYLSHLKEEMGALATIVDSGTAEREVACSWLYALRQGYAFLVRDDTGELVTHRRLGDQERQENLLEVLREPTGEQIAEWTASLGLVIDQQQDLELAAPGDGEEVAYARAFVLQGEHGQEKITARFSEADHRPASLTGVYVHDEGTPQSSEWQDLPFETEPETLRTYRRALEDLLEARKAEAQRSRGEVDEPTPIERGRKAK